MDQVTGTKIVESTERRQIKIERLNAFIKEGQEIDASAGKYKIMDSLYVPKPTEMQYEYRVEEFLKNYFDQMTVQAFRDNGWRSLDKLLNEITA